jgi:ribonuclease HI
MTRQSGSDLVIYTDGACQGNPGPGGWAAVLDRRGRFEEIGGWERHTTNNRMEMLAAIEGLRRARPGEAVRVVTDSRYLHDGISRWIHAWKRRGWKKADGGEVLNRDLWEQLDDSCRRAGTPVAWEHVRGHSGHALNERCDAIATAFSRGERPELRSGDGSWIQGLGPDSLAEGLRYPLYLSLVEGELRVHLDWEDCEHWVKGAKGARYKKVKARHELAGILVAWAVPDAIARRLGLL